MCTNDCVQGPHQFFLCNSKMTRQIILFGNHVEEYVMIISYIFLKILEKITFNIEQRLGVILRYLCYHCQQIVMSVAFR